MRWLLGAGLAAVILLALFFAIARGAVFANKESVQRMQTAAQKSAARIQTETGFAAAVVPAWQKSFSTDLERVDVVVTFQPIPPTAQPEEVRSRSEAIVREEFKGQNLFSVRVDVPLLSGGARR